MRNYAACVGLFNQKKSKIKKSRAKCLYNTSKAHPMAITENYFLLPKQISVFTGWPLKSLQIESEIEMKRKAYERAKNIQ